MRVKLIGVSDEARKSESVARAKRDRRRLIAPLLTHLGEAVRQQRACRLNVDSPHLGNFQELHPRVHHHLLHPGGGDLLLQSIENDMVNHEGKANRRFQRRVQVRIHASENDGGCT